jgi:hypothetical protein
MDICGETLIGFVCAHGDAFELLELAEEVFDQMTPIVDFRVDRQRRRASWMLRDNDLSAALVAVGNDGIAVEGLVRDEAIKGEAVDKQSDSDRIKTMAGHENEAHEIAERIGQRNGQVVFAWQAKEDKDARLGKEENVGRRAVPRG